MAIIDSLKLETLSTDGSGFASIDGDFASNLVAQNQSFGSIDIGGLNSALSQLGGQDAALAGSVRSRVEAGLTPVEQGQLAAEADIVVTAQARPVSDAEIFAYDQAAQDRPVEAVVFNNVRELDVAEGRFRVEQALTGPKANDPEIEAAYATARPGLEAKDAAAAAIADRATLDVVKAVIPPLETATAAYRVGVNGEYTLEHGVTLGASVLGASGLGKIAGVEARVSGIALGNGAIITTEKGVSLTPELLSLQGSSKLVGDFRALEGASVEEIVSRIPDNWVVAAQQRGLGIRFLDGSGAERLRLHGPNMRAPAGSNSAAGWTARIHVPGDSHGYYDSAGHIVGKNADDGHIPIHGNPNASSR